ncbi:MAG: CPBP family intramembrane metalloprotease [Deltaproteobacteria bacterium]|nr:CPBP family intramembrane metalloprotease [Deltaproteobacteria bacterium]
MSVALLASLAWLTAFIAGRATGNLYPFLASTAGLLLIALLATNPALRQRCKGGPVDVVVGVVVGVASLAFTYGAFPVVVGLMPSVLDEVTALYALAAVTPSSLALVFIVIVAEEVTWRGAMLEALRERLGVAAVVVAAIPYAIAQSGGGSFILPVAAIGFGVVWGGLAYWRKSLVAPLIAHALWTPIVLGLWPLV